MTLTNPRWQIDQNPATEFVFGRQADMFIDVSNFTGGNLTFQLVTLYVLFFITHERRELLHLNVTASPTAAWIWRPVLEATPWSRRPTYLIHDRDAVYGGDFDLRLANLDIAGVRTPPRAPTAAVSGCKSPLPSPGVNRGRGRVAACLGRPAPRLWEGCLNSDGVLPPFNPAAG